MTQTICITGRPWGLNAERSKHWTAHRSQTRTVREAAAWLALANRMRPMEQVRIQVQTGMARPLLDTGSNLPTVKAIIDGLVDAGVLKDDSPEYVLELAFLAPQPVPKGAEQWTLLVLHDAHPE